jgi:hypothetical protein
MNDVALTRTRRVQRKSTATTEQYARLVHLVTPAHHDATRSIPSLGKREEFVTLEFSSFKTLMPHGDPGLSSTLTEKKEWDYSSSKDAHHKITDVHT